MRFCCVVTISLAVPFESECFGDCVRLKKKRCERLAKLTMRALWILGDVEGDIEAAFALSLLRSCLDVKHLGC